MQELKPCPFCGGKAEMVEHTFHLIPGSYGVKCVSCGAKTEQFFLDAESATKAWNRRTEQLVFHCDETEDIPDCTVRIYRNTETGEEDWGWFRNNKPPRNLNEVDINDV